MTLVLVVEDDAAILRGLTDNLEAESYVVLTARDGEAGYAILEQEEPDLVILDLMLPKLSGYEICQRARSSGMTVPILMLTAKGFSHTGDSGRKGRTRSSGIAGMMPDMSV